MSKRRISIAIVTTVLTAPLVLALASYLYIGLFSRYLADDYCIIQVALNKGFWTAQIHWYTQWTGRFAFTFITCLVGLTGPRGTPFALGALLILLLASASWTIYQILRPRFPYARASSLTLAALLTFVTINGAPNLPESFYWLTGAITYIGPLIILTAYVGVLFYVFERADGEHRGKLRILCFCLTFIGGGLSDTYVALQSAGLCMALVACLVWSSTASRHVILLLVFGLCGSLLAMAVLVASPGNQVRQAYYPPSPDFLTIVTWAAYEGWSFMYTSGLRAPSLTGMSFLTPALVILSMILDDKYCFSLKGNTRKVILALGLSPIVGFVLITCCFAPAIYGMSQTLPTRALIIPWFMLVGLIIFWSSLATMLLLSVLPLNRNNGYRYLSIATIATAIMLAKYPLGVSRNTFELGAEAKAYSKRWDQTDSYLRSAKQKGLTAVVIPPLKSKDIRLSGGQFVLLLESDPQNWKNECAADYYGLESIKVQ